MVLCGTKNGSSIAWTTFWSTFIFKSDYKGKRYKGYTACKCEVWSNVLVSLKVSAVPQASVSIEEPIIHWLCAGGPAVPSLNTQQRSPEAAGLTRAAQSPTATHALCQRSCAVRSTQWSSPRWIQTEARSSSVTAGCIQVMDFSAEAQQWFRLFVLLFIALDKISKQMETNHMNMEPEVWQNLLPSFESVVL